MLPKQVADILHQDAKLLPILAIATVEERPDFNGDVYYGLLRAVAYQQLSGKAATTIFNRFLALFPDEYPEPNRLLAFSETDLRSVGLSRAKTLYMQHIAEYFIAHRLFSIDWHQLSDQAIVEQLTAIKGVGKWTAEMVLMFILHRPDILPLDDLVVRNRMIQLYGLGDLKGKAQTQALEAVAEKWRPYRSWGSRLMWAWAHTEM